MTVERALRLIAGAFVILSVLGLTETQLQSGPEARGTAETKPKR